MVPTMTINENDEYIYKKFNYKDFNNSHFIPIQKKLFQEKLVLNEFSNLTKSKKPKVKNEKFMINKNNLEVKPSQKNKEEKKEELNLNKKSYENSLESFFNDDLNSSIECSTLLSDSPLLSVYSLKMQKLKNKKKKLRFLNKKEFPQEYNPKLITTKECIQFYFWFSLLNL